MEPLDRLLAAGPVIAGAAGAMALIVLSAELLRRRGWAPERTRRWVHVGVGMVVVALPFGTLDWLPVTALALAFTGLNAGALWSGRVAAIHEGRSDSVGTVTFPLALAVTAPWAWTPERVWILQTAFLALATADPLAGWIGRSAPAARRIRIGEGTKSVDGTAAVAATTFLVVAVAVPLFRGPTGGVTGTVLAVAGLGALVVSATELLGGRGWDNFFVVVALALVLAVGFERPGGTERLAAGVGAGVLFGAGSIRAGWLTAGGGCAGGLFAATLIALGGWPWTAPALAFFVTSSLLTGVPGGPRGRVPDGPRRGRGASSGPSAPLLARPGRGGRSAGQVYANGGVAWVLLVVREVAPADPWLLAAFLGALGAATADTWSAEVGPRLGARPVDLRTGRRVPVGTSGAISALGTAAGVLGALVVGAAFLATGPDARPLGGPVRLLVAVGLAGTIGSLVDSLLGAFGQALFVHTLSGTRSEDRPPRWGRRRRCGVRSTPVPWRLLRGRAWLDNERVNAACTAAGAVAGAVLAALA